MINWRKFPVFATTLANISYFPIYLSSDYSLSLEIQISMASQTYQSVVLARRPKDDIVPGTFNLKTQSIPTEADLKDGSVLVEALYLSLDPAMRGWLNGKNL